MCIARLIKHSLYQSVLVRSFRTLWVYYMVDKEYFVLSRRLRTFWLHDTTDWGFIGCILRWIKNTLYHTKDWEHLKCIKRWIKNTCMYYTGDWEMLLLHYMGDKSHFVLCGGLWTLWQYYKGERFVLLEGRKTLWLFDCATHVTT